MRKIFKYTLEVCDVQTFMMAVGAKVLNVQMQGHQIALWALVDLKNNQESHRTFFIIGTGNDIDYDIPQRTLNEGYIGTVQQGIYVWHIFEDLI